MLILKETTYCSLQPNLLEKHPLASYTVLFTHGPLRYHRTPQRRSVNTLTLANITKHAHKRCVINSKGERPAGSKNNITQQNKRLQNFEYACAIWRVRYFRNLSNIDDRVRNISWQTLNLTQTLILTLTLTIYIHIHIHGHL